MVEKFCVSVQELGCDLLEINARLLLHAFLHAFLDCTTTVGESS